MHIINRLNFRLLVEGILLKHNNIIRSTMILKMAPYPRPLSS